jgi:hypothetical protein
MKRHTLVQGLVLSLALAAGSSALAQVNFNIVLAPPPPVYEVVPMMPQGYVWAPGYWAWNHDRHIWMRGRSMVQRTGYRWEPDRWEQHNGIYSRQVGRWERDLAPPPVKAMKMQKTKHDNRQNNRGQSGKKRMDERNNDR